MTTHENFIPSDSQNLSPQNEAIIPPLVNPIPDSKNRVKQGGTLRRRLLITVLPTVLIPLAVATAIASNLVETRVKGEKIENIETQVVSTGLVSSRTLDAGLTVTELLAANPFILEKLESGTQKVENEGLAKQPIEEIEKQFAATKLLIPNQSLNDYLRTISKKSGLAEIILTEKNGFNVGYNIPTSDFVQSDEEWWQTGAEQGATILEPEFDESTRSAIIELVGSINNPETGELLGVTKIGVDVAELNEKLIESLGIEFGGSQQIQIIDSRSGRVIDTVFGGGSDINQSREIVGGEAIIEASHILSEFFEEAEVDFDIEDYSEEQLEELERQISAIAGISEAEFEQEEEEEFIVSINEAETAEEEEQERNILSFNYEDKLFHLKVIPETHFVVVSSIDNAELAQAGSELRNILILITAVLGVVATGIIFLLARNLSKPLTNLTAKAQQVAAGDLDVQAELQGTEETQTLAQSFNNLVGRVKDLIQGQEAIANQQKQEKEKLEQEIYQLLEDVQDAADGDLTVRASLDSMEMSTVADLFNAVIDNLQDIAVQVKGSSNQVSTSLGENKESIQILAEQAIQEAEQTRNTLDAVEQMSHSIEKVATNASQAANLAEDAYQETQEGTTAMDETVNSILSLRTTVGETANKMKRLGESSQKIAQIVSLIEEIALKTNLLAINASRTGDQGQGFNVFGEQLAKLGEQSAAATKQIAQIANEIKLETQEVSEAMETGNSQAVNTTHLVESTKQRLEQVLNTSRTINELMQSISQATISQTDTSGLVTKLMQQIAQQSEQRLTSSQQVSQSMETTAQVAKELELAVEKFRVSQE